MKLTSPACKTINRLNKQLFMLFGVYLVSGNKKRKNFFPLGRDTFKHDTMSSDKYFARETKSLAYQYLFV